MNSQNGKQGRHMLVEADIGSGEITPGQEDTDKIIEQIGKPAQEKPRNDKSGAARPSEDNEADR